MFDVQFCAEQIELVFPSSYPLAQAKKPVDELLAIVCGSGANADRTGAFKITQEAAGIGRRLSVVDTDKTQRVTRYRILRAKL